MADAADEKDETTIATGSVLTKYQSAASIVNEVMKTLVAETVPGAQILELCEKGDKLLHDKCQEVFKKEKKIKKGVAFPTCISVNHCVCHFSPLASESPILIKDDDLVKIDMGAHIDGYIAVLAHSFVVGASPDNKVTGKKADVMLAAHNAAEAALRLIKPGTENTTVTDAIQTIAEDFSCKPVEGMMSHQLKQHTIDGEKSIIQNPTEAQRKEHEKCEIDVHEVYAVDILVSSGEGKGREKDARTTVYKKKDVVYNLKMKTSRDFSREVDKNHGLMPFTLRAFESEARARMAVTECLKHGVVEPFSVLFEREGEFVAQFKFTLFVLPNGPTKATSMPFDASLYTSEHSVKDEKMKALLKQSVSKKATKSKKKKAEAAAMIETAAAAAATASET